MIGIVHLASLLLLCYGIVTNAVAQSCSSNTEIPPATPALRFVSHINGTVTDKKTGLMWAKCSEGLSVFDCTGSPTSFTWQGALDVAHSSTLAEYNDWRLPNIKELLSIVEEQCNNPAINITVFPNTPASAFWTASPVTGSSGAAWIVPFDYGEATGLYRYYAKHVRLVRSGQ